MRVIPDISADADPATGVLVGQTASPSPGQPTTGYTEFPAGGTSVACPLIAGIQADLQQAHGEVPIGFANPAIYARYGTPAYHDVTGNPFPHGMTRDDVIPVPILLGVSTPTLFTFGMDLGLTATPGYDDVSGVGTPAPGYFASQPR